MIGSFLVVNCLLLVVNCDFFLRQNCTLFESQMLNLSREVLLSLRRAQCEGAKAISSREVPNEQSLTRRAGHDCDRNRKRPDDDE